MVFLLLFFFCFDSSLNFYSGRRYLKCISKVLITNITLDIYKCGFCCCCYWCCSCCGCCICYCIFWISLNVVYKRFSHSGRGALMLMLMFMLLLLLMLMLMLTLMLNTNVKFCCQFCRFPFFDSRFPFVCLFARC